ncbi:MAG: sulfite exporter TauE/SafE family protein [Actinomycetota bacterium]|nr:sulfite exporter TauE/SafE family protein [Actinomycetota bacterium]
MEFLVLFVAVGLGAVVQGSVGFGFALVVVPALTLLRPEALPATVLLLSLPMAATMAVRERHAIDVPGLAYLLLGRLAGTFGGVGLLLLVPDSHLSVLFGSLVVAAVIASSFSPEVDLRNRTRVAGGIASGIMGTAAGIGGPPLALIYQSRSGPQIRATLAIAFSMGTMISILALAIAGRVGPEHLLLALGLLPALLLGLWSARLAAGLLAGRWLRPAVLLFAAVSGLVAVLLGIVR